MEKKDNCKTSKGKNLSEILYERYIRIKNKEDDPSPDETDHESKISTKPDFGDFETAIDYRTIGMNSVIKEKIDRQNKKKEDDKRSGKDKKKYPDSSNLKIILNTVNRLEEHCEIREGGIVIPKVPRIVTVHDVRFHYRDSNGKECVFTLLPKIQWVYYGGSLVQIKRKTKTDELRTIDWIIYRGIEILLDKIDSIPEEYKPKVGNKSITMSYMTLIEQH